MVELCLAKFYQNIALTNKIMRTYVKKFIGAHYPLHVWYNKSSMACVARSVAASVSVKSFLNEKIPEQKNGTLKKATKKYKTFSTGIMPKVH